MPVQSEFKGPSLDNGPLPAVIYFAVSANESLNLDPFDQPVNFLLEKDNLRVFSFTLPGHGPGQDKMTAMTYWADHPNELENFVEDARAEITRLTEEGYLNGQIAVAGLSRGAYLGLQLAASDDRIQAVCGFAPLIKLRFLEELKDTTGLKINLDSLVNKAIRLYIGNNDTRVGTENAYEFIRDLTKISLEQGIRSPKTELMIYPSIGYKGHGTPPEIFRSGAEWLLGQL